MYKLSLLLILTLLLIGCEKPIDFSLDESKTKLVVEAIIENDQPPVVVLTNSLNYFSDISPQIVAGSFVHNAQITISNGIKTHQLKEYRVPVFGGYNLYYYSIDSAAMATAFNGKVNTAYSLKIIADGAEYIANTTIPSITKKIDSIWWKPAPRDTTNQQVVVIVKASDPKGYGDYVRYYTRRNGETYLPGIASVYDDLIIDGTTYDLDVEPGYDRNADRTEEERAFKRGDTVTLKLSNIDKTTFDFWRTMEYSYSSIGNPFSTPTKVLNNISNGALGYFGGYASQYKTIIIPK